MKEKKEIFKLTGIKCGGCVKEVEGLLNGLDWVLDVSVDLASEEVTVSYQVNKYDFSSMKDLLGKKSFGISRQ